MRDFGDLAAWQKAPTTFTQGVVEVKKMLTAFHRKVTADG